MRTSTSSSTSRCRTIIRCGPTPASPSPRTPPPSPSRAPPSPRSSRTSSACAAASRRSTWSISTPATRNRTLTPNSVSVLKFWIPVLAASLGREVEEVPERPDHVDMARILTGLGPGVKELGAVEVAYAGILAEHVEDGHLRAVGGFTTVVAVVVVLLRGQELQLRPAAASRMLENARKRRLRDDHEVGPPRDVLGIAVQPVE